MKLSQFTNNQLTQVYTVGAQVRHLIDFIISRSIANIYLDVYPLSADFAKLLTRFGVISSILLAMYMAVRPMS